MRPTDDERREVAGRLREKHRERNAPGMFEVQDVGMQAYGYMHDLIDCLPDGESAFTVIADLIDPICHIGFIDTTTWTDGGCEYDHEYACSACGAFFTDDYDAELTAWLSGRGEKPFNYCPNCGARVVSDDE